MKNNLTRMLILALCLALSFTSFALAEETEEALAAEAVEQSVEEAGEALLGEEDDKPAGDEASEPEAGDAVESEAEDVSSEAAAEAQAIDLIEEEAIGEEDADAASEPSFALMEPTGDIALSAANFPDANFLAFVKQYDKDSSGALSEAERNSVTDMDILTKVTTLKGIENFPNLKHLDVGGNTLTELDVSGNTSLETLLCAENSLTALDLSKNTSLKTLSCAKNKLTSLSVANCAVLSQLSCEGNSLTTLDISTCPLLVAVVDVSVKTPVYTDQTVMYGEDSGSYLKCDTSVTIVGGNPATTTSTTVTVTIKKRNTKGTAYLGKTYQIDLGTYTGKNFKSSNKKVAAVSSTGLIKPKKAGKARITFKVGKKKCTINLKVVDPTVPKSVTLDQTGTVAATKGETVTLTATLPEGTNSSIKWTTSDKKVATVSNGVVTFKKKGKVIITATATRGKKKAKVKFKVSE